MAKETSKPAAIVPSFNLNEHDYASVAEEGRWLEIRDPGTKEILGLEILVYGEDSPQAKTARQKVQNRNLHEGKKTGRKVKNVEDIEESGVIFAVGISGGWRVRTDDMTDKKTPKTYVDYLPADDQKIKFTRKAARAVYDEHKFIAEQVIDFSDERVNFKPAS